MDEWIEEVMDKAEMTYLRMRLKSLEDKNE